MIGPTHGPVLSELEIEAIHQRYTTSRGRKILEINPQVLDYSQSKIFKAWENRMPPRRTACWVCGEIMANCKTAVMIKRDDYGTTTQGPHDVCPDREACCNRVSARLFQAAVESS